MLIFCAAAPTPSAAAQAIESAIVRVAVMESPLETYETVHGNPRLFRQYRQEVVECLSVVVEHHRARDRSLVREPVRDPDYGPVAGLRRRRRARLQVVVPQERL